MPATIRSGSRVSQTVQTTKNFPLTIDHVRRMFEVANLKERTILSLAVDTGLRISDFLSIRQEDLPPLDKELPLAFELLTQKEKIPAHCFLSRESVDLLKKYLPTLQKKNTLYLFSSNARATFQTKESAKC
jgi:integrase